MTRTQRHPTSTDVPAAIDLRHIGGAKATVLVGASGGADSTALVLCLAAARDAGRVREVVLGHVDHGWRAPEEANADWAMVRSLAQRVGARAVRSPPPPSGTPRTEDAARKHRYRELARMAEEAGATKVAVAHHVGDQAETFLMRLLRGSGIVGLAGIPASRPLGDSGLEVVRPMLEVEPAAIRKWLREQDVRWREDPANADPSWDRVRIRERLRAHPANDLARLAARLRARVERREAAVVASAQERWRVYPLAGAVRLPRGWLQTLDNALLLGLALRAAGRMVGAEAHGPWFTRRHLVIAARLLRDGGALDLPHGMRLHVAGGGAWLVRTPPRVTTIPALVVDRVADVRVRQVDGRSEVVMDAAALGDAPVLRRLTPDDRFVPMGSPSGRERPVVEWLSKQGVPGFARRGVLVVEGAQGVAWVVGERMDARHRVTDATAQAVRLSLR